MLRLVKSYDVAGKLTQLDRGVRTVDLVPTAGVFWDHD